MRRSLFRAGSPTVTVSAETVGVQNRDAAVSVRAGAPTVAVTAQVEQVALEPSDLSGESLVGVRYRTRDGDSLDAVCWRHYGRQAGAVEAVLEANPGLSEVGPVLPAGFVLGLPDLPRPPRKSRPLASGIELGPGIAPRIATRGPCRAFAGALVVWIVLKRQRRPGPELATGR